MDERCWCLSHSFLEKSTLLSNDEWYRWREILSHAIESSRGGGNRREQLVVAFPVARDVKSEASREIEDRVFDDKKRKGSLAFKIGKNNGSSERLLGLRRGSCEEPSGWSWRHAVARVVQERNVKRFFRIGTAIFFVSEESTRRFAEGAAPFIVRSRVHVDQHDLVSAESYGFRLSDSLTSRLDENCRHASTHVDGFSSEHETTAKRCASIL